MGKAKETITSMVDEDEDDNIDCNECECNDDDDEFGDDVDFEFGG